VPEPVFSVAAPPRSRQAEVAAPTPPESSTEAPDGARGGWWPDLWHLAPTLIAAALAVVYLIIKPRSPDLAAHIFRSELFGREGFTIWNGQWYGGHHTPAYSILSPPIGWLLGPQLMGAISAVVATACFTEVARKHFGHRAARFGTMWFAIGSATLLFTNRLPFALGVAFGMAAVVALQRKRPVLAPVLGILCAISSPVAGLFLAMVGVGKALAAKGGAWAPGRREGVALAAAAFVPPVLLTLAFPEGGYASWLSRALSARSAS
jgi:hypothetical protein